VPVAAVDWVLVAAVDWVPVAVVEWVPVGWVPVEWVPVAVVEFGEKMMMTDCPADQRFWTPSCAMKTAFSKQKVFLLSNILTFACCRLADCKVDDQPVLLKVASIFINFQR
jgi:hypothetical protein